ncbi:MAG: hypothetical protein M0Q43_13540 [Methanothrix sp.]|jgi:hypothetical protein|nr:hypothetical protein [Methanothrix sp.]
MIGLSLIFGLCYYAFNGITMTSETTSIAVNTTNLSIYQFIYFSIMTMMGKPPISFAPIGGWKYIVMIEGFLGYLLMALFVFIIIRKL